MIGRRKFITLLGGAAAAWPLAVRAQPQGKLPTIGFLGSATASTESERAAAFAQRLRELGWIDGVNARIEVRWTNGNIEQAGKLAKELVSLRPDAIFSGSTPVTNALLQETRAIPVIFAVVSDPVGAGFVESLARPGGNATGFMTAEYSMGGKWLELLKQIAPGVTRVAVLRNPANPSQTAQFGAIQAVAPSLRVEVTPVNTRDAGEIERAVAAFARAPNGGLITTAGGAGVTLHRDLIITLAARHKLPAVYSESFFVAVGGLISYGPDYVDQYRQAAGYVDRILKGEKPADLPVQAPDKYDLVINLKTAKALGLTVPPQLLARADEVIE